MQQIERGVFYEDGYLGVTLGGLIFSHGVIMIDAPLRAEDARSWRSALVNQRGGANRLLVNMDAHPDRTLGDRALDTTTVAHQKTAQVFRNRPTIFKGHTLDTGAAWEFYQDAVGMRWAVPDITFNQRMSLHWGGPEIVLEHHPGSSPGAIWVIIPDLKVVFVGDAVVKEQPPFLVNADISLWIETLDLLKKTFRDYVIVSGRGGPVAPEEVKRQQAFLQKVQKELDKLAKRNASLDAVDSLVPKLLETISYSKEFEEMYTQRLRFGLTQYYNRRNRNSDVSEMTMSEEEEE